MVRPSPTATSTSVPTNSPMLCTPWASAQTCWWACASNAPLTWWSACWLFSRPAVPMSRLIPACLPSAWPSWCRMPRPRCCSLSMHCSATCPLPARTCSAWIRIPRSSPSSRAPTPPARCGSPTWPMCATPRGPLACPTGADPLQPYPPARLPFALINNYGPPEPTVVATSGLVPPLATGAQAERPPTIGRPIANTQVYLLDEHLRPVPPGSPGELYIGGRGVASGYLRRPELTAERFLPPPWSAAPGAQPYKSGDLARHLPAGQLEVLGRRDHQHKLQGCRIEPGEIVA